MEKVEPTTMQMNVQFHKYSCIVSIVSKPNISIKWQFGVKLAEMAPPGVVKLFVFCDNCTTRKPTELWLVQSTTVVLNTAWLNTPPLVPFVKFHVPSCN